MRFPKLIEITLLSSLFPLDSSRDARGVLREAWYNVNYNSKNSKAPTMRENPAFDPTPQSRIILRDFEAPVNVGEKYIQRLTTYLQVGMDFILSNVRVVSEKKMNLRKLALLLSKLPGHFFIQVFESKDETRFDALKSDNVPQLPLEETYLDAFLFC